MSTNHLNAYNNTLLGFPQRCKVERKPSPPSPCGGGAGGEGICRALILKTLTLTLSRRARGFPGGG